MEQRKTFIEQANEQNLETLKKRALEVHKRNVQQIKDFAALQPHHPFTAANQHILELSEQSTWDAAGVLTMTGLGWWALNLTADLSPPQMVVFNATGGPDWDIALFTSSVAGYFYVDPSTLGGEYNFQMEAVAGVAGEVSLNLYETNGTQIANFLGAVLGVSISTVSGTGTLKYSS